MYSCPPPVRLLYIPAISSTAAGAAGRRAAPIQPLLHDCRRRRPSAAVERPSPASDGVRRGDRGLRGGGAVRRRAGRQRGDLLPRAGASLSRRTEQEPLAPEAGKGAVRRGGKRKSEVVRDLLGLLPHHCEVVFFSSRVRSCGVEKSRLGGEVRRRCEAWRRGRAAGGFLRGMEGRPTKGYEGV